MAIDSHSHIYDSEFDNDYDLVLERAKENNVYKIVLVGYSHEANLKAYNKALEHPGFLYNTAGLHPDQTDISEERDVVLLEEFIKTHKVYAIGEIGLDYHYEDYNHDKQKWLFEEQIKLAIKYRLPIVIHSRDADQDTFDILKKYSKDVKILMHCYSGSKELMQEYIKIGAYISLGGPVTFKNSVKPKEVAKAVPVERLLIETDSPYMAPAPMRGQRNESSFVVYVLKEISELRNMDSKELENILDQNTIQFFNLD